MDLRENIFLLWKKKKLWNLCSKHLSQTVCRCDFYDHQQHSSSVHWPMISCAEGLSSIKSETTKAMWRCFIHFSVVRRAAGFTSWLPGEASQWGYCCRESPLHADWSDSACSQMEMGDPTADGKAVFCSVCLSCAGVTNSWSCELQCGGSASLVGCSVSCAEAEVTLTFVHCKRSRGKWITRTSRCDYWLFASQIMQ